MSQIVTPVLRSFDQAQVEAFYFGFLGFVQDWSHQFAPDLPLYQQISLPSRVGAAPCVLHLSEHFGDGCPGANLRIAWPGVADFQRELLAKAYRNARPGLEVTPWGTQELRLHDPFHNRLVFYQDLPEGTAAGSATS